MRPDGFPERIKTEARFGYGWRGHFDRDAAEGSLNPGTSAMDPILSTKKAYFWGLRGDWTLKLKYSVSICSPSVKLEHTGCDNGVNTYLATVAPPNGGATLYKQYRIGSGSWQTLTSNHISTNSRLYLRAYACCGGSCGTWVSTSMEMPPCGGGGGGSRPK